MNINFVNLFNKFLELRKSPAFIIFAIIGLFDIIVIFLHLNTKTVMALILFVYMVMQVILFPFFIIAILILFLIEKILKIKIKNNFTEENKLYKVLWLISFLSAILFFIYSFILLHNLPPSF